MTLVKKISDRELIELFRQGDHDAYTEIYSRYSGVLYLHAYNKLRNREEVKDIIQELFTTLWINRESISLEINLAGYLYQAIQNRVLKLYAYKKVRSVYIDKIQEVHEAGNQITDHLIRTKQLAEMIEQEVNTLPEKMREVFLLSRKNYMSHKMISQYLGIAETTVKAHIHHALKILRGKLTPMVLMMLLARYLL
ncbi:RNA polymerase sigma factor [Mucilaginibacter angelicae]|uniref:RNA polymerase sigma factor n=1 Tax=Mucilaginibacter angelicae TaxID=869718 RepID=A0ABV6L0R2_9SPHI